MHGHAGEHWALPEPVGVPDFGVAEPVSRGRTELIDAMTVRQGTLFHSPTTGFQGTVFGSHTMLDVLKQRAGGAGYGTLGMYCAAALLNAASGRTPFLSEAAVRQMWNDNLSLGYYEPTPGIRWDATQIIAYLRSTMH